MIFHIISYSEKAVLGEVDYIIKVSTRNAHTMRLIKYKVELLNFNNQTVWLHYKDRFVYYN